jgi:hypothetical protein
VLCALWLRLVEEAQAEEGYLAGVWVGVRGGEGSATPVLPCNTTQV